MKNLFHCLTRARGMRVNMTVDKGQNQRDLNLNKNIGKHVTVSLIKHVKYMTKDHSCWLLWFAALVMVYDLNGVNSGQIHREAKRFKECTVYERHTA